VRSVRAIGDAAPGDASTTKERVELRWGKGDGPSPMVFDQAPAGKYANIDILIRGEGESHSYQISGMVTVRGTSYPYEIEDDEPLSVSVQLPSSATLPAGGSLSVGVRVNLKDIVRDLDFASVPIDDGVIKIKDEDSGRAVLTAARAAMVKAFHHDD
jgi:hypothetical protein